MAKLEARTQLAAEEANQELDLLDVDVGDAGGTNDTVDAVGRAPAHGLQSHLGHGEVDDDLGPGTGDGIDVAGDLNAGAVGAGDLTEIDAGQTGIHGGHQLQIRVLRHGPTDLAAHTASGAEDADSQGLGHVSKS